MLKIDSHELAWAAGLFDGEGHIAQQHRNRNVDTHMRRVYSTIVLDMRQVDRRVLDRFNAATWNLGKVYGPYKKINPKHQPFYSYCCTRFEHVQQVVVLMWKWSSPVKRQQAKFALAAFRDKPRLRPGRKTTVERNAQRVKGSTYTILDYLQ